ncbi:transposase [Streptomyces sp. NRRL F-5122]|uniref:HARBI1 family protein n=1 Tax=Streptomyces sp. NRRL F-5122 TaxID=1609098 RepID=UPI000740F357|nr:transposase family protein [Streptomyces sp. NRRL F-5122]KUJ33578.1 transposase [Streptomyces sp. NRRL F-5122]
MPTSVTYTAVLDVRRSTAEHLSRLLRDHRAAVGTRGGRRALGCFRQAVLILRWFLDGTRLAQLARDNGLSSSTAYRYLHEGLTVLAAGAPDLNTALERAKAAGLTHLNLDGTVVRTDRVAAPGPNGADLWWSGKHRHHGGNVQVISTPDGWPIWVSPVRPGREHDTTCARHHGRLDALNNLAAEPGVPTLVDLGYENAGDGLRHPVKKPASGELTEAQHTYNKVIRGVHGVCERANSLLKTTFKALRRVSLDPSRITQIAAAALVLLQLEYDRTI